MLGYAVETRPARRKASPTTLALIVAGHLALILTVINSKMDLPEQFKDKPPEIFNVPLPKDPPPAEPRQPDTRVPQQLPMDRVPPIVPIPDFRPANPDVPLPIPTTPDSGTLPIPIPDVSAPVVRVGPKPVTANSLLRPPYPEVMRRLEEEAVLRLRLAIDERGRVRSVDPVGTADPMFLASARNHLIRHWRYTPANEGGHAVPASIVITLRFKLDEI